VTSGKYLLVQDLFDTGFTVDLNTWQHVAATFDPINGVTFYKNGQASGTSLLGYDTISKPQLP